MTDHNRLAPPSTSSSASPTIHEEPGVTSPVDIEDTDPNIADKRLNEKTKGLPASDTQAEDDVLVVNWEGPDDPENPKKCVSLLSFICVNLLTLWVQPPVFPLPQLEFWAKMGCDRYRLGLYIY